MSQSHPRPGTSQPGTSQPGRPRPADSVLAAIGFLLLDVDGVLTDGRIWFDGTGTECKSFHVHDAAGLAYWHRAGLRSGLLSGRGGPTVERRAHELGVHEVVLHRLDKGQALGEILARQQIEPQRVCYVGDDLVDLPVLRAVGFAVTVPEARAEVKAVAHHVTERPAGFGAVRDVVELLLRARGAFDDVLRRYGGP